MMPQLRLAFTNGLNCFYAFYFLGLNQTLDAIDYRGHCEAATQLVVQHQMAG